MIRRVVTVDTFDGVRTCAEVASCIPDRRASLQCPGDRRVFERVRRCHDPEDLRHREPRFFNLLKSDRQLVARLPILRRDLLNLVPQQSSRGRKSGAGP